MVMKKDKLTKFIGELQELKRHCEEKVSTKNAIMGRLTYILNDDATLAKFVYDYCVRGHLAYANTLRSAFSKVRK